MRTVLNILARAGGWHAGLGPVSDLDGNIDIQIRDLDQTVIGNPAHDFLRLGLSLAMAAAVQICLA